MSQPVSVQKRFVQSNGSNLYCEIRGQGPAILFISGSTGDAGHFEDVAEQLSDSFTVITYDRRGNSRSLKPPEWKKTSIQEQVEDAAGLIKDLGVGPVGVFGSSSAGVMALDLTLRYPELVRGTLLHEPVIATLNPTESGPFFAQLQARLSAALKTGGTRAAVEAFCRAVAGDSVYEGLKPDLRERILNNGETLLFIEMASFRDYQVNEAAIRGLQRPIQPLYSPETYLKFTRPICEWLALISGTQVGELTGGHACYLDRPDETARLLRTYFEQMNAI